MRDIEEAGDVSVCHLGTAFNLADLFTKALPVPRFRALWNGLRSGYGKLSDWVASMIASGNAPAESAPEQSAEVEAEASEPLRKPTVWVLDYKPGPSIKVRRLWS